MNNDPEICTLCSEAKHIHNCNECGGLGWLAHQNHRLGCHFCNNRGWFRDCVNPKCKAFNKDAAADLQSKERGQS